MSKRIVVTGGNRGIGHEIVRQLAELGNEVILTARSEEKGEQAANELGVSFMQLDTSSKRSIQSFVEKFNDTYSSLDVLINNAAILIDSGMNVMNIDLDLVRQTIETNVMGVWQLIQSMHKSLAKSDDPRVINISSGMGAQSDMVGDHPAYRISKSTLNSLTRMIHSQAGHEFTINAMCPGWVRTDMGGSDASRPVEKGAETAVWLASEERIPNGKFLRDKKVIDW